MIINQMSNQTPNKFKSQNNYLKNRFNKNLYNSNTNNNNNKL